MLRKELMPALAIRSGSDTTFRQASDLLQGNILIQMGKYFSDHDRVFNAGNNLHVATAFVAGLKFFVLKERDAVRKVCRPILVFHLMGMPDLQLRQPAREIRTVDPERSDNRDDYDDYLDDKSRGGFC